MTPEKEHPAPLRPAMPEASSLAGNTETAEPFAYVTESEMPRNRAENPLQDILRHFEPLKMSDEEAEQAEREQLEAEARKEHAARLARFDEFCPPFYRHPETLADMRERIPPRTLQAALNWRPGGRKCGLLLHGDTGGFKTTLLFQIARRVIVKEGARRVVLLRGDTLGRDAAAAYGDPAKTAAWGKLYREARWLMIDELFKGSVTPSAMSALFDIIEHRTAHLLPTVATSNATSARIESSAKDPAAQEAVSPILRRIAGEPGRPGFFTCLHIPAPA